MHKTIFCADLPTRPNPKIGRILVTGASGYIGGRLVPELLTRGYRVRALVRRDSPEYHERWARAEVAIADVLHSSQTGLEAALKGIDTAYYLLHSLHLGPKEFEAADLKAARNFRKAAEKQKVKRIIYLGGLGDVRNPLSSHLQNRIEVANELKKGRVPVTSLRAAIIIGSGSASYEIVRHLVRKVPVIPIPTWAENRCQPIAVRDVIKYLVGVLETPKTKGNDFDIGGRDVLTYKSMLAILGRIRRKKQVFIPFPFFPIRFGAYITSFFTPVPHPITHCLLEGLKNDVVCRDNTIKTLIPFEPLAYREAVVRAMSREDQDRVATRWSDAYPPAHELAIKLHELSKKPAYRSVYAILSKKQPAALFQSTCQIGGRKGWFNNNWLWRLRGILDRMLMGVGTSRGRKNYSFLEINDVVDFWRIEDLKKDRRLLLRAEMKLPGRAWLEFSIKKGISGLQTLYVIAHFDTKTLFGKLYWYACLPFHALIFQKLLKDIEKRS